MGSPVSPVVANLYVKTLEEIAIRTAEHPLQIWKCYVDDTFCVMKTEVEGFLSHFNSIRPSIMFTTEQQEDDNLLYTWTPSSTGRMTELLKSVYTGSQLTQTDTCISPPTTLPM